MGRITPLLPVLAGLHRIPSIAVPARSLNAKQ